MLLLIRSPTRIVHQPSFEPTIEGRPRGGVTATIRHDPTYHQPLHLSLPQQLLQIGVEERIIRVFANQGHRTFFRCGLLDLGDELPVLTAGGDGARRTPFAHELVGVRGFELGGGVAVLGEDAG